MSFHRRLFVSVAWVVALMWAFLAAVLLGGPYSRPAEAAQVVTTTADDGGGACTCSCACQAPLTPVCSSDAGSVKDAGPDVRETGLDAREAGSDARDAGGATPTPDAGACGVSRPSWSTGIGFFVASGKLYDGNGCLFRPVGVNKLHWDAPSVGLFGSNPTGSNAVRWVIDFAQSTQTNLDLMQKSIAAKQVPIPGNWDGTCNESVTTFNSIVNRWVAQASAWKAVERYALFNIANEWGPDNSLVWRDQYISAISKMRSAGYLGTIVVDSGGCGQNVDDIANYAPAVFNSDPQKNVVFDIHIYGLWCDPASGCQSWQTQLSEGLNRLALAGVPVICGEYGPGKNIGPSGTNMSPGTIMQACASRGFGTLAWAWDDPAGEFTAGGCKDDWFCMSRNGAYAASTDLTLFGKDVIENPTYGVKATAKKATVF